MKIKYLATLISAAIALSCYGSSSEPVSLPRPEYPRPQFERKDWTNLNGEWSYTFDFGKSGKEHGYSESTGFQNSIIVPFCPESTLSGVGHTDFINAMWYHRNLSIPEDWDGKKSFLTSAALIIVRKYSSMANHCSLTMEVAHLLPLI